jgi:hypothetical protein
LRSIENIAGTAQVSSYTYGVNFLGQRENVTTSGSAFAGITYYYAYDHLSRMMARGETTALNRRYYYDGWNRIAEYTTSFWTAHNTFTWGLDLSGTMQGAGGVGGLLVMRWVSDAGQPDYFPTYDGNGNVSEY